MRTIDWIAEIQCEYGGPAIIAAASEYEKWLGATPYPLSGRSQLHYWGQFTAELPEPYRQEGGGHVRRECSDLDALRKERDALIASVERCFDGAKATVDDAAGEAHILLPDNRQMWIKFAPESQYDEACESDEAVWQHEYATPRGSKGRAVFWEKEGAGSFSVGVSKERQELLLLRTWIDEDEFENFAKTHVSNVPDGQEQDSDVTLEVGQDPIVVAYSPFGHLELIGAERLNAIFAEVKEQGLGREEARNKVAGAFRAVIKGADSSVVLLNAPDADQEDVAAAFSLRAGQYRVRLGTFSADENEEEGWSCIWCRFVRTENTD